MAGFFGLFGNKNKYVDEPAEVIEPQRKDAFYLEPDDAKTLGNIDFMRKPNTIKRSFPATANSKGAKVVRKISSIEALKLNENAAIAPKAVTQNENSSSNNGSTRRASSDMDAFLKMARDIKK